MKLLRHLLSTLQTPSLYLADSNQTPSRHLLDILHTTLRHPPNSSLLYCIKVGFSTKAGVGWVADPHCRIMPLHGPTCKIARFQAELKFPSWTECGNKRSIFFRRSVICCNWCLKKHWDGGNPLKHIN